MSRGIGAPAPVADIGTLELFEEMVDPFPLNTSRNRRIACYDLADRNQVPPFTADLLVGGPFLTIMVTPTVDSGKAFELSIEDGGFAPVTWPLVLCPMNMTTVVSYKMTSAFVSITLENPADGGDGAVSWGIFTRTK